MSSFIVEYRVIDRFLSIFEKKAKYGCAYAKIPTGYLDMDELGRALLKMNIDATEARYSEPYMNEKEKTEYIAGYVFKNQSKTSPIVSLKAAHCLQYQCSEGSIPKRKLYKWLVDAMASMSIFIVSDLKAYDEAPWSE